MQAGQTIRDYVLEKRIDQNEGAMGEVWRASHRLLNRPVAIKVIAEPLLNAPEFETRFLQEAQVQAKLTHPRIVSVTDFFHEQGRYYLVMQLVEGQSLKARIESAGGPLPLKEALQIAQDILEALDYAHQQGVIHRDVKPSNILLDYRGHA